MWFQFNISKGGERHSPYPDGLLTFTLLLALIGASPHLAQETPTDSPVNPQAAPQDGAPPATNVPPAVPEPPLYEQDPFDVVVLDEANKNARLKIVYLTLPGRRLPLNPPADSVLNVRLLDTPDEEYEIAWRNIRRVELFEEMLLAEGVRLIEEARKATDPEAKGKLLDEAFSFLFRVRQFDPKWPGLNEAIDRFLFWDAANLVAQKRLAEAFSVIEQLFTRNPTFRLTETSPTVGDIMSRVLDRILNTYFEEKNYLGIRSLIKGMSQKYGENKPAAVDLWTTKLTDLAAAKRDEGKAHLDNQRFRDAIVASQSMMSLWPDVQGGRELNLAISSAYPMVFVGVIQPALQFEVQRLDDWAARRTGRLVYRTLVEFLGAGPEGGEYQLAIGSIQHSDDRRKLTLRLKQAPEGQAPITGYDVSRRVLELANPKSPEYSPAWASLIHTASVKDVYTVEIELTRAHVLPEAFLRVPLVPPAPKENPPAEGDGPFRVQSQTESEIQFANKSFVPGGRLAEIVEKHFTTTQAALSALRRGEVNVLDRLFPADALRVRAEQASLNPTIRIEPYALPTVHLIVPNPKNPFLANRDFRRALLIATNRDSILKQELMGGRNYPGFQVVSGPFPASSGEADPLGYAYDEETLPMPYNAPLAKALLLVAQKQIKDLATKRGDPEPVLGKLVLGYPSHEIARNACQAIASQWQVIGLQIETREFPPGQSEDSSGECDLVYKEIAIWEPVVDARRMLGPTGFAPTDSPYVRQSLRFLDLSENWGQARDQLIDIHRAVYNDVAVLPLWQTVDFFAYQSRINNIGASPVWLYQNIDQWRVSVEGPAG